MLITKKENCANKRISWVWHGYEKSTWFDMCEHMSWHAESDLNRWYNVMQSPDKPKTPRIWTLTVQTNSWTASLPHNSTQLMIYIHLFRFGAKPSIFTTPVTSVNQDHLHSVIQCDFIWSKEYFDSVALAHHPMQYLGELLFFHTPLYIRGVWKNINSPKYYIGWCARATEQSFNFFRK